MPYSRNPEWSGFYIEHEAFPYDVGGPSRTRQEFADECDINNIMAQYQTTGALNHLNQYEPQYLDLTNVPDLQSALHVLDAAGTAFANLPAQVRREFDNNVQQFVSFAENPQNLERMREWGLAAPQAPAEAPILVRLDNPPPTPGAPPKAP